MTQQITTTFTEMMQQAWATADLYMGRAVKCIDRQFGDGFAKKNPALVGAFMQTASLDFMGGEIAQQIRAGLDQLAENTGHPNSMEEVKSGLDKIAENVGHSDDLAVAEAIERLACAVEDSFPSLDT